MTRPEVKKLRELYGRNFPESKPRLLRVPGRINLLGTHIEHRGGFVNYLAVDKNLWVVAGIRKDTRVVALNLDRRYPEVRFEISSIAPPEKMTWEDFVRTVKPTAGAWENYLKAPFSFLQNRFRSKRLCGLNLCFWGEIPVGAGLSSSSAVIVAATLLAAGANGLRLSKKELVEIAGRSEWYVGTRGGWGDHAAMIFGKKGKISHLQFFPFRIQYLPFPKGCRVICANSLIEAKKSTSARGIFNERIAGYEIGFKMIKNRFPEFASRLKFLRDINPEIIGSEKIIYRMLRALPEETTRSELRELFCGEKEWLESLFETHPEPAVYRIRDTVFYGISECERSRVCAGLLKTSRLQEFGKLMYISHNGDRVVEYRNQTSGVPWRWRADDGYLQRTRGPLYLQPGAYRCSTPELDFMVDTVKKIDGVLGAKLTGAGMGGCVLILVKESAADEVLETLKTRYYLKRGLPEEVFVCNSTNGAEFL